MQHPLVNPSLTPFGFCFTRRSARLKPLPNQMINGDRVAAKFWTVANRLSVSTSRPAETIIQDILPSLSNLFSVKKGDFQFAGNWYYSRDIAVLSSLFYWFGTNVGSGFLRESASRCSPSYLKSARTWRVDIVSHIVHECVPECTKVRFDGIRCVKDESFITDRDRAIIEAALIWLNQSDGRAYRVGLDAEFKRVNDARYTRNLEKCS